MRNQKFFRIYKIQGEELSSTQINDIMDNGLKQATTVASGPANLKSLDTNLKANIKSIDGATIANVKSLDGIT